MTFLVGMAIWMGGGALALGQGSALLSGLGIQRLPAGFVAWALLFFVLGYLVYASALGALGALAPNTREGSQFTFVLLLPLMAPIWLNTIFIQAPNSIAATVLSLFPLSAPAAMPTRLAAGGVPAWQPFVSAAGLAITTYFLVLLAARFFRADTLLSSVSLSWRRIAKQARR